MVKSKVINPEQVSEEDVLDAVRTLIRWAGDDPDRPGLQETPARVLEFYRTFFHAPDLNADAYADSAIPALGDDDFILIKDIHLASFCEHHMLPSTGVAHIAYVPRETMAGLGTLARIAMDCAARLTVQEQLTCDIAATIESAFDPFGVAVMSEFSHGCMSLRRPYQVQSKAVSIKFSGSFEVNTDLQKRFFMLINKNDQKDMVSADVT